MPLRCELDVAAVVLSRNIDTLAVLRHHPAFLAELLRLIDKSLTMQSTPIFLVRRQVRGSTQDLLGSFPAQHSSS